MAALYRLPLALWPKMADHNRGIYSPIADSRPAALDIARRRWSIDGPPRLVAVAGMDLDSTNLLLSLLFGSIGMGMVMYSRKAGKLAPAAAGVMLMVFPYFIGSVALMVVIGLMLTAVPFIFRDF